MDLESPLFFHSGSQRLHQPAANIAGKDSMEAIARLGSHLRDLARTRTNRPVHNFLLLFTAV